MVGSGRIRLASAAFLDDGFEPAPVGDGREPMSRDQIVQSDQVDLRSLLQIGWASATSAPLVAVSSDDPDGDMYVMEPSASDDFLVPGRVEADDAWPPAEPAGPGMDWIAAGRSFVDAEPLSNGPMAGKRLTPRPFTFSWEASAAPQAAGDAEFKLLSVDSLLLPTRDLPCFATPLPAPPTCDAMLRELEVLTDYSSPPTLTGAAGRQGAVSAALRATMTRQFALSYGQGPVLARSRPSFLTELQEHPPINLAASVAAQNHTQVRLDLSAEPPALAGEAAAATTAWPEFHAGVSRALSYGHLGTFGRTWIAYNAPTSASYWFGGVLYGLGLAGNLASLSETDMYRYLSIEHDATLMGFLLGISASKRGTMDESTEKILRLHHQITPVLQELGILSHIGAIVGYGLLYQKSHQWGAVNKLMSLLNAQPPSDEAHADQDFESRNFAVGIAIGLVMMGSTEPTDMRYDRLMRLLRPAPTLQEQMHAASADAKAFSRGSMPAVRWLTLSLMFLGSGGLASADEFRDWKFMSSQFAQLALFLGIADWNSISNTEAWIWSHLPANLQAPGDRRRALDPEIAAQLHESRCFYLAGSALAVGLKHAGTGDAGAASAVYAVIQHLLAARGAGEAEIVDRCLGTCASALAVVLAGTGDLKAFRLIRSLLRRVRLPKEGEEPTLPYVAYGAYASLCQALGFLFLGGGGYTFSRSIEAAAYLLIALFPFSTTSPADNRHYLQAYRHLYVLAMEKKEDVGGRAGRDPFRYDIKPIQAEISLD